MSNNTKDIARIAENRKPVDGAVRGLIQDSESEKTLAPFTPSAQFARVLKTWQQIKPLVTLVSSLSLLPSGWRAALVIFGQALDGLAAAGPEIQAQFKAGKDL